jgi:two-component system, sensor histidine kinase RegB
MLTYAKSIDGHIAPENLVRVMVVRAILIFALVLGLWIGTSKLGMSLPLEPILLAIGALVALNIGRMLRMNAISQTELFIELVLDSVALTLVLYFSGGISNPFVSFYLVQLTLGAMLLPGRLSWSLASLLLCLYTILIFFYQPMVHRHDSGLGNNPAFNLHTVGAWLTFALSLLIVATFLVRMVSSLRQYERKLAFAREEHFRNERIVALGALAASTAHELGTPLSTIAVIAKELERRLDSSPQLREMLQSLRTQVDVCKSSLTSLTHNSGAARIESCSLRAANDFIAETLTEWHAMRPDAKFIFSLESAAPPPSIIDEPTLKHALISVLNNAADVSPESIKVRTNWNNQQLSIEVIDAGPGLSDQNLQRAGNTPFSTKSSRQGLGIGLYLARATLERFGGSLTLANSQQGGLRATILLPAN